MPKHNTPRPPKPALPPEDALFQAISLARKAGRLVMGFDAVEEAAVKGKAWLALTAADASPKTVAAAAQQHRRPGGRAAHPAVHGPAGPPGPPPGGSLRRDRPQSGQALLRQAGRCGVIKHEEEMTE